MEALRTGIRKFPAITSLQDELTLLRRGARQFAKRAPMPHRLALQSARFAEACEVEMRVGKIRIGVERRAIAVDRPLRLPKVLLQDRQVEEERRIAKV